MKPRDIVPILLAAGGSQRLGFPRPLALFGRRSALQIALANCRGLGRPILVLGCDASAILPHVPRGVRVVLNRRWRSGGQLSSLLAALRHVPPASAFLLYPIDQPLLQRHTIQSLVRAFLSRLPHQQIVLPRHGRETGHPILVSAALRHEFESAPTARHVIYKKKSRIRELPVPTTAIFTDFSTPDSYLSCLKKFLSRRR
ncbi:MAG: NTP transferase domain-containing protein [Acidobacteriia bacterium]|nr:NTP transferase domain-containing protein [Terriglobia bacterium]